MRYDGYQYLILCEDKAHFYFIRGWLLRKGVSDSKIYPYASLPIKGDASDFVEKNFNKAKSSLRSKTPNTYLIAVCDVDEEDMEKMAPRFGIADNEKVFLVLPKRSIETWCQFLDNPDEKVDENISYKKWRNKYKFGSFGKKLASVKMDTAEFSQNCPSSLKYTIEMIKKKKNSLP